MNASAYLLIVLSLCMALCLSVMPLPYSMNIARPEWVALLLIFWVVQLPQHFGVLCAWAMGLLLDGVEGTLLGSHALSLAVIAYISLKLYQRIRMYALWQQALLVFGLIIIKQLISQWVLSLTGYPVWNWYFVLPAVTSALIWPALVLLMLAVARFWGWNRFILPT